LTLRAWCAEGHVEDDKMNQHQIRIMNWPEPSSEELFVRKASQAHALARRWSEGAVSAGLEELLFRSDRSALQELVGKARSRELLSVEGRETIGRLAETCARRIAGLVDPDTPATRSKALVLHDNSEELHALAAALDEVLDLEHALQTRHRISAVLKCEGPDPAVASGPPFGQISIVGHRRKAYELALHGRVMRRRVARLELDETVTAASPSTIPTLSG
jgi:hypothetical protein